MWSCGCTHTWLIHLIHLSSWCPDRHWVWRSWSWSWLSLDPLRVLVLSWYPLVLVLVLDLGEVVLPTTLVVSAQVWAGSVSLSQPSTGCVLQVRSELSVPSTDRKWSRKLPGAALSRKWLREWGAGTWAPGEAQVKVMVLMRWEGSTGQSQVSCKTWSRSWLWPLTLEQEGPGLNLSID